MIIFLSQMSPIILYSALGAISILIIAILIIMYQHRKKEKSLDTAELENILTALGERSNIKDVKLEQQRIQLNVFDIKKIDAAFFTKEKIPAFMTGNKITVLFKEHAKEIYIFLASKGA